MIARASLYLVTADDARAARTRVAGHPVAFRAIISALRAGVHLVTVPAALRSPELERAIQASPTARARVVWIDGRAPAAGDAALLLPATAVVSSPALERLLHAPPPAVLAPAAGGAPVVAADAALVRALAGTLAAGTPLGDGLPRALAARAATPVPAVDGWQVRVDGPAAAREAERRLYALLGSPIDTALDVAIHRRLSRRVSRAAIAAGATANLVSGASLLVGLTAAWCFAQAAPGWLLAGLLGYLAAVVLDHADGEVARLTLAESPLGAWLDVVVDTVVLASVVLGLGLAAERVAGSGAWLGAVAAAGVALSAVLAAVAPPEACRPGTTGALDGLSSRDGFYATLLAFIGLRVLAPPALPWLMGLVAVGSHAFWVARTAALVRRQAPVGSRAGSRSR